MTAPVLDPDRPTLEQLRARVHKDRHREIGNWLARAWVRPSAVYGTWLAVRLGLSAHQVTALALASSLGSAIAIGTGWRGGFVWGVALAWLAFWLDRVDGQVARWRGTASLDGVYADYLMHHVSSMALGFALGHGLAVRTGAPIWSAAGFAIALGWLGLSLHNDCRYKAFFQRLKRASGRFAVVGGGGGRPSPPTPWPKHGLGALTWPASKVCEGHVVLVVLSVLAALPANLGEPALAGYVVAMAVLAPVLAAARAARAVGRGAVEEEFDRWFRPDPDGARSRARPSSARRNTALHPRHQAD